MVLNELVLPSSVLPLFGVETNVKSNIIYVHDSERKFVGKLELCVYKHKEANWDRNVEDACL